MYVIHVTMYSLSCTSVVHRNKVVEQVVSILEHPMCLTSWCWALAVAVVKLFLELVPGGAVRDLEQCGREETHNKFCAL